ncbi:MAG TPA: hypothetical protein VKB79_23855 [Bryobacteraceae bacterium]|nr:hypothetical protein [Bryobacteraceae bacterium]
MITVVMLNFARPRNALFNLQTYSSYRIVKDILCFNNGAPLVSGRLPRKCVLMEASKDLGLYSRFAAASLATTDAVFHTDDDLIVPEKTLEALYSYWFRAKSSCHGLYGRVAYPTYKYGNVFGPVEVLLTRAMMCSRRVNNIALSATELFNDLRGKPRGNGEDIILSFAGMAASKRLNLAYRLPAKNHAGEEPFAIHRMPDHLEHRRLIVSRCRRVFFGQTA